MIKTPVKGKKTNKEGNSSRGKASTQSNSKINNSGKDLEISRAIKKFICTTLKPILDSKKKKLETATPKNKHQQILSAYQRQKSQSQCIPCDSSFNDQTATKSKSQREHKQAIKRKSLKKEKLARMEDPLQRETGKSQTARKYMNDQMKKNKKRKASNLVVEAPVKSVPGQAPIKKSLKKIIDLNKLEKNHPERLSLLKLQMKQNTERIYKTKKDSHSNSISELEKTQAELRMQLKSQIDHSKTIIEQSAREQQNLKLKHKQLVQELQREMSTINSQLKIEESKRADLENQVKSYEKQILTTREVLNKKQLQYEGLNKSNNTFFQQHDRIRETVKNYEKTIKQLEDKVREIQRKSKSMETQLKEAENQKQIIKKNAQDVLKMLQEQHGEALLWKPASKYQSYTSGFDNPTL